MVYDLWINTQGPEARDYFSEGAWQIDTSLLLILGFPLNIFMCHLKNLQTKKNGLGIAKKSDIALTKSGTWSHHTHVHSFT